MGKRCWRQSQRGEERTGRRAAARPWQGPGETRAARAARGGAPHRNIAIAWSTEVFLFLKKNFLFLNGNA